MAHNAGDRDPTWSHPHPLPAAPPEAWEPLLRLARLASRPLERFLQIEAASGVLLIAAAVVAMVWANSAWAESYRALWHAPVGIVLGDFRFERSLEWVVNDGLMVIFFFVVGLEIRREIHHGELSEPRRAALPAAAAIGGMLAPALVYLSIAGDPATRAGWGVPMATDIAFAVGVLALLGKRVPAALRVLMLALAVIDDLGAILVIAFFYSSGIALTGVLVASLGIGAIFAMQWLGVRAKLAYVLPTVVAWAGIYAAGVHPTVAGVIVGMITPVRAWLGPEGFLVGVRNELEHLSRVGTEHLSPHELALTMNHVSLVRREAMSPAESLIESLHPWVAFAIMPIFALANAGVSLQGLTLGPSSASAISGIALGLFIGKPLGVFVISWLALRMRIAVLPAGLGQRHLLVLGVVAGVGFTMALFIAQLAFTDVALLSAAKIGVLVASVAAAVTGLMLGRALLAAPEAAPAVVIAESADQAECSTEQ